VIAFFSKNIKSLSLENISE